MFLEMANRYPNGSRFGEASAKLIVGKKRKEVKKMQWEFIVAMVIAIPLILIPVALVWYLNVGGLLKALQRRVRSTGEEAKGVAKTE